jgi:RNA polymerase sigma factor (sigma-70 family)
MASSGVEDVQRALGGDAGAVRALVDRLAPSVRVAVGRVLFRHRSKSSHRDLAQEAEDIAQDVFVALFEGGGRVLASWDPARGASLETFVRLVAERKALDTLRSLRRSPFTEEPTLDDELEAVARVARGADDLLEAHDLLQRLDDRLKQALSPRGYTLYLRLFVDEAPVDVVARDFAMAPDAIYAWKYRFTKTVRAALDELLSAASPRIVEGAAS